MKTINVVLGVVFAAFVVAVDTGGSGRAMQTGIGFVAARLCGGSAAMGAEEPTRVCLGRALDVAADLWALARQF